jgi:hypothetical protein
MISTMGTDGSHTVETEILLPSAGTAGEDGAPLGPRTASLIRGGPHASDVYLQIMRRGI